MASLAARSLDALRRDTLPQYVPVEQRVPLSEFRRQQRIDTDATDDTDDVSFHFCEDEDLNERLESLADEARHVFDRHADGHWRTDYREEYARRLCAEIRANPWLIKRLLAMKDRLIASLTYRAMQLRDQATSD